MTRKLSRSYSLSVVAPFFAVMIAFVAMPALAQTTGTGRRSFEHAVAPTQQDTGAPEQAVHPPLLPGATRPQDARPMDEYPLQFLPVATYDPGGTGSLSVAVGDMNGDGHPDLVVGNLCQSSSNCASSGNVGVLLGNGDGTFQAPIITGGFGYYVTSVAVGDMNGDGILDLLVNTECPYYSYKEHYCVPDDGYVGLALGNGDGTFHGGEAVPAYWYGSYGASLTLGDLNGDGNLDLAVGLYCWECQNDGENDSFLTVMVGYGNGTLQFSSSLYNSGGGYPVTNSVAMGDVNGDGKLDLVAASCASGVDCAYFQNTGGTVGVLLGNGDGTFQSAVSYNSGGDIAQSVAIGDVNGDGIPDLVVANCASSSSSGCTGGNPGVVSVLLGNGDGTFQPAVTYSSGGNDAQSIAIADMNGDGIPDVVVANVGSNTVGVLLGNGDGTFQAPVTYDSGGIGPYAVAVADLDGDGRLDIVLANCSGPCWSGAEEGVVGVLLNDTQYTPVASTTALVSSPNPSIYGQVVTFTASVSAEGDTPTGTVEFFNGNVLLGNAALKNGTALFTAYWLPGGSDSIVAKYQGDGEYLPSASSSVTQVVNPAKTTTSLGSSANPSVFGEVVTFTAQVGSTSPFTPVGTVEFFDGSTALGSGTLASGSTSISIASLMAGPHLITAAYQGSVDFGASTSPQLNQVVMTAATTTSLVSSVNPVDPRKPVTYLATIASQYGGAATGTVTFRDGGTTVATVSVTNNQAAYTTTYKSGGAHAITATFSGDPNNVGSISATLTEYVAIYASRTVLTTSGSPSQFGQPVTFTATVTSEHGAIPDGDLVTFYDGKTTLGSAALASGMAEYTTSTLLAGTHTIKAVYDGDAIYEISSATVAQIVDKNATTTSLSSSVNPSQYRQAVTFTAQVASSGPTPTGKVKFRDGTTGIGMVTMSGGVATLTKSKLAVGTHAITAEYLGDPNNKESTSPELDQVVQ